MNYVGASCIQQHVQWISLLYSLIIRKYENEPCLDTPIRNAGHSKWQNIMHTKMSNDAKKQAVRSKLAFQIKSAIRGN